MKWLLLAGVVVVVGLIARAIHRYQLADHVSADWLFEQARRDEVNTFEGVTWNWPVRKSANEAS